MPATIDELATGLQQFFATQFPLDGDDGPGSVLLVFDNLGRPLSPQEFAGSGTDAAVDLLSHQRAADLADQLPAGNALKRGWYLPRGGSRLSRWYAAVLTGSTGPPASAGEAERAAFEAAKAAARRQLDLNQLVAVAGTSAGGTAGTVAASGTLDTYYATSMSPLGWFSDASPGWVTYQVAADDRPDDTQPQASLVTAPEFTFMVAQDPRLAEVATYLQYATLTEPDPPVQPDPAWVPLLQDPGLSSRLGVGPKVEITASPAVAASVPLVSAATDAARPAGLVFARLAGLRRADLADPASDTIDELTGNAVPPENLPPELNVEAINAALASQAAAPTVVAASVPTPATSSGFAVQFEYTLVRLDRPWWDDTFLHRRDWRMPGYEPGQISTGSAADPNGEVTLITIGMLVIRNLTITANWSAADLAALPHSTSLGPFCIAAGTFDRSTGTLTRKGMQAAAWLCQVPTRMPPD